MDTNQFYQTLDEILFTNVEITSAALAWAIYLLAQHSCVQDKLQDAIRHVEVKSFADLNKIEYLEAVVLEIARYRPAVALTIPERTATDMYLGDYIIPAHVSVTLPALSPTHPPHK